MLTGKSLKYVYFVNLPRTVEYFLSEFIRDIECIHHYFISDKEYIKKRNVLIVDWIEPANLVRFCRLLKRHSLDIDENSELTPMNNNNNRIIQEDLLEDVNHEG